MPNATGCAVGAPATDPCRHCDVLLGLTGVHVIGVQRHARRNRRRPRPILRDLLVPGLQHQRLYSRHDPLLQAQTRKSFPKRDTSTPARTSRIRRSTNHRELNQRWNKTSVHNVDVRLSQQCDQSIACRPNTGAGQRAVDRRTSWPVAAVRKSARLPQTADRLVAPSSRHGTSPAKMH